MFMRRRAQQVARSLVLWVRIHLQQSRLVLSHWFVVRRASDRSSHKTNDCGWAGGEQNFGKFCKFVCVRVAISVFVH